MAPAIIVPQAKDDFFEGENGLVAVFDYDYEEIIDFNVKLKWAQFACIPPMWLSFLCCVPCFIHKNVEWDTRSRHIAITVDGIKFVHNRRKFLCGLSCSDRGKESKTVPFDKITDCDVQEPAGTACCCFIPRTLHQVHVDTASSGQKDDNGVLRHELAIEGLKEPHEFKKLVWQMKRHQMSFGAAAPVTQSPKQFEMGNVADSKCPELLTEIRDELKKLNSLMGAKYGATASKAA